MCLGEGTFILISALFYDQNKLFELFIYMKVIVLTGGQCIAVHSVFKYMLVKCQKSKFYCIQM